MWLDDLPIASIDGGGATTYLAPDASGQPTRSYDTNGNTVLIRFQDPFTNQAQSWQGSTDLRYPGQLFDAESGLSNNGFRDYDPTLGRYVESDPIGQAGGANPYGYVGQNPLMGVDPMGLLGDYECAKIGICDRANQNSALPTPHQVMIAVGVAGMAIPVVDLVELGAGALLGDAAFEASSATICEVGGEEATTLYRGVDALHPGYGDALEGVANPIGGDASIIDHVFGNTASEYTSWTSDYSVAEEFATRESGSGVILSNSFSQYELIPSPGNAMFGESEYLIQGSTAGSRVIPVP